MSHTKIKKKISLYLCGDNCDQYIYTKNTTIYIHISNNNIKIVTFAFVNNIYYIIICEIFIILCIYNIIFLIIIY